MDLNIRDFPDDLAKRVKIKAVATGSTLKDYLIGILESSVDEGPQVTCPMCGLDGPLVRLGTNARCFHCGSGFVPPEM